MNTIQIKRRSSNGNAGAPQSLLTGEIAYNEADNKMYYGADGDILEIAGPGAYITLSTEQTINSPKTFTGSVDLGGSASAVTKSKETNDTSVATAAFVQDVASLLDGGEF